LYNHYPISFWRWIVCIKNLKINPAQGGVFRFYGKEVKNMKAEEKIFVPDWQDFLFIINGSRELAEHTFPQSIAQMYWYDTRHHGGHGSRELNRDMILPPAWFRND